MILHLHPAASSSLGLLLAVLQLLFQSCAGEDAAVVSLVTATDPFTVATHDSSKKMIMEVQVPESHHVICSTERNMFNPELSEKICGGMFTLDLASSDKIQVTFEAPQRYEIQMDTDTPDGIRFEFSAHIMEFDAVCTDTQEFYGGINFVPRLQGSDVAELVFNTSASWVTLDTCELTTEVRFDGPTEPGSTATVKSMTIEVWHDKNRVREGEHEYHYATNSYMHVLAPNAIQVPEGEEIVTIGGDVGVGMKGEGVSTSTEPDDEEGDGEDEEAYSGSETDGIASKSGPAVANSLSSAAYSVGRGATDSRVYTVLATATAIFAAFSFSS